MTNHPHAGFFRRLAALVYDTLLAASVWVSAHIVGFITVAISAQFGFPNVSHFNGDIGAYLMSQAWYSLYLISAVALFFIWFWTHGGQTLGMKAWRLRIQNEDGSTIHLRQAIVRVCFALGGLGNLAILVDPKRKRALQDRLSDSVVIVLPKGENKPLPKH
ncbi:RDD family protein [Echinimonas agarilytica]|uniref:RDD family protein n=1 Tax=Echinimonas agarilytica TaxID=1215918 RepID=A0AA41W8J7_9GAMM|nr:RDD family protein [Echinimonas agarilytica]MCM2680417.1 RDD family protein [Echinimonas agarilytica]